MKYKTKRFASIFSLLIAMVLVLTGCSCGQKSIKSLKVKEGTLQYNYIKDSEYNFDDLVVIVTYNDGSKEEVAKDNLEISAFDTSTVGNHQVTITYSNKSIDLILKVVNNANDLVNILGFEKPSSITLRESAKAEKENTPEAKESEFFLRNKSYVIGDDNPFKFFPEITAVDDATNPVVVNSYTSTSTIYIKENGVFVKLEGNNVATYVVINEVNSTYDFTEAAIGKEFKLEVSPNEEIYGENEFATSLEFKVVDGYNITTAKELGVINNFSEYTSTSYENDVDLVSEWNTFLTNNNISKPTNLASVVLHNNLQITVNDIPSKYFSPNKDYISDYVDVYHRLLNNNEEFTIYGNYFTIDASQLPLVNLTIIPQSDKVSHTTLFKFTTNTVLGGSANMVDLSLIGNVNRTESTDNKYFGGMIMNKFNGVVGNIENTIIKTFYINTYNEARSVMNLNYVKSYDAYQGSIFSYGGDLINVTNSELKRSGGPAAILQHVRPNENTTTNIPVLVVDSNTVVESYLNGDEPWFVNLGLDTLAGSIKALNQIFAMGNRTFLQNGKMNIIAISMTTGLDISGTGAQGKVTIGNKEVVNMMHGQNQEVDEFFETYGRAAPVFQSSEGGYAAFMGEQVGLKDLSGGDNIPASLFQGDYLGLYYSGVGITLGYYSA